MKKYIYLCIWGITTMLTACSQNEEPADMVAAEGLQTVTFSLTPGEMQQTRATQEVAIKRYVMEVYEGEDTTTPANVFGTGGSTTHHLQQATPEFKVVLDRKKSYTCLFWADNEDEENRPVYNIENLTQVTLRPSKMANENSFYATQTVNGAQATYDVVLTRAVAKISLWEKDKIAANSTLTVTCTFADKFNVFSGSVTDYASGTATVAKIQFQEAAVNATPENPVNIGNFFLLAPASGRNLGKFFCYLNEGGEKETQTYISSVPVQANFITNVKGEYSQYTTKDFDVSLDNTWTEENGYPSN